MEGSAQPIPARRGGPGEAPSGALGPVRLGNRAGVRREVVAEDELADPGALGDAPDLRDVGVQPGHPPERLTGDAVPLQVAQVGDLVDQDVGPLREGDPASFAVVSPENTTEPSAVSNR